MAERSMRNTLRRYVAPVALVGALLLLAHQTCQAESSKLTVHIELGAAKADHLRVLVYREGETESVAAFDRALRSGPDRPLELQLSDGMYRFAFRVDTPTGVRRFDKRVRAGGSARVTINIEPELLAEP